MARKRKPSAEYIELRYEFDAVLVYRIEEMSRTGLPLMRQCF